MKAAFLTSFLFMLVVCSYGQGLSNSVKGREPKTKLSPNVAVDSTSANGTRRESPTQQTGISALDNGRKSRRTDGRGNKSNSNKATKNSAELKVLTNENKK